MKSSVSHKLSRMTDVGVILPDSLALEQIKPVSRNVYKKAFDCLREFIGRDFEDSGPSESELISFIKDLREVKKAASSTLWTTYSMINSVCKAKYNLDLKKFTRVTSLIKAMQIDSKKKASVFTTKEIDDFLKDESISTPYWLVRKVAVILAFFGGLRLCETLDLQLEKVQSTAEGVHVTHERSKQRSDKRDSTFLVPRTRQEGTVDYAGILDAYLNEIKNSLGIFTGRVLWTGRPTGFVNSHFGKNKVAEIPKEMARTLSIPTDVHLLLQQPMLGQLLIKWWTSLAGLIIK